MGLILQQEASDWEYGIVILVDELGPCKKRSNNIDHRFRMDPNETYSASQ